ncbi:hypothetical protein [Amycolatopsis pittospori]|uniref:hypothetical protein n=1 Tax=Amycolatopsis pittospori TaxID=2749434 RepID=UPI0015F0F777|nr:hypothetical protein [Amycolatopsis pittospori]
MRLGITFLLVLVLTACGTTAPPPSDPETLVLRAKTYVGMPSPRVAVLPEFSLYGGGRLLVPGEPEGALQIVREKRLDAGTAESVHDSAYGADLDRDEYVPNDGVIDGYLLVFTLYGGHQVRAATPQSDSGGRLEELADFQDELADVAKEAESVPKPYRPTRIAAIGWASSKQPDGADVREWPFAAFAGTQHVDGGLCTVMEGDALSQAETLARSATPTTRWRTADTTWLVVFRPLLPDEKSCSDLVVPRQNQ